MTSGLLVRHIPAQCPRASLYDHFTDPQHGGGPLDYLLFPLGADASRALVVFSDHKVLPRVLLPTHRVHGQVLKVAPAPRQTFAACTAEVDPLLLASLDDPEVVLSSLAADCGVDILRDPVRLSGSFLQIQTAQAGLDAEFQRAHAAQQRELLMVGKRPRHARSPHRSRRHVYDSSTTDDELGNQSLPAMYLRTSAAVKISPQGISGQKAAWPEPQGRSSPIISDSEGVPDKKARSVVASDSSLVVDDQIVPLSDQSAEEGDLIQAVQMATTESAPPQKSKSRSRSSSATSAHGFTDKEVTSDPNSGKSYILLELDHYVVTYMRKIQQRKIKAVEADNEVKVSYKACGDLSEVLIQPVDPSRPSQRRLEAAQAGLVSVYQALFYSVVKETVALAPAALPAEVYEAVMSAVRKAFSQTVVFQENLSQGEIVIIGGWSHVSVAADWIREKFGLQRTGADAKKKPKSAGSLDLSSDSQKMRLIMDLSPTRKAVSKEEAKALVQQRKDDLTKERERRSVDTRFTQSMPAASASDLQAEASRILAQTQPVQYDADMSDCGSTDGGPVIVQSQLVEAHSKAPKARKTLDGDTSDKESQHSQVLSPRQDVSSPRGSGILSPKGDITSPRASDILSASRHSDVVSPEPAFDDPILPMNSLLTSKAPSKTAAAENDLQSPRGSGITSPRPDDYLSPRGSAIASPRHEDYFSPRGSGITSPRHEDYLSPRGSGIASPRHENFLSPRGSAIGSPRPEDYKSPRGSGLLSPRLDDFLSPRGTTDHNWWEVFSFTTNQGLTVKICNGDLTVAKVDAIVSAANERLENIGGVARAISKVVGSTYEDSCLEHVTKYGYLQVSEVVGLPVRCDRSWSNVLQAYGPMWALYTDKDQCAMVLKETFLNAFKYADTVLQIRSLATPAISAGVFGVPLDVCARAMFDALHSFSRSQTSSSSLREVVIVNLDEETTNVISAIFQQLLEAANQSGGYESDTSSFFKDVETDKQDDDGELDDLIKANTQTEAFSAPRASRRESDDEEDYESESDVPAITRGDMALTHSALRTTSKKSETKGFEDIFEKELDEDGGLSGAKHSPSTSVKDFRTSPRSSGRDATSPRDSMKDISSPRGSVRESLKDITSPRQSLRDIKSPQESLKDITSPRESLKEITSPRQSLRDITSPRESLKDITSPRESLRDITSPKESLRDITSPRESLRDITSPRESVRDITSPRQSLRDITSPRESLKDITSPRESLRDITSPRENLRDITSPRESLRDITSPRESLRDITSPRESLRDITSPRQSLKDITSPRESLRDITSPRESLRDITSPRESLRDITSPRESLRDITSPRESLRYITSPRESVRDITSPRESMRDITSPRESMRDITSPRESLNDITSPRCSIKDVTSPRSVRDITSPRNSSRDTASPRTSVKDVTSPRNGVRDATSPRDSIRDVTSPRNSVRDVTSPRNSDRDVTSPRNNDRDVTSPRTSARDVTSPRNSIRDVTSPRNSVRDVTSPRTSVRDVTSPRDSFRDVTSPRTSVRDVTSPRNTARDVTSPRDSVRDVTSPRNSVRDVTSPRDSVRDVTSPRDSIREVTSPRNSARDVTSPRSSIKDLSSPRNSARDVTSPRASIKDVTSPRNSDGGHSSRREQDLTSPRTSHKDITSPRSPRGPQMKCEISRGTQLAGESSPGAVIVRFSFPDHEDVVSYLPNTPVGRELIQPLRRAHEAGLAVRVNDAGDVVSGDLQLKANTDGGADSGYPDPDYVSRLRAQLSALGFI